MITIARSREILGENDMSDEEIEEIRDFLYAFSKNVTRMELQAYEESITQQET